MMMDARSEGENIDGSGTQRAVLAGVVSPVCLGGSNINEFCSLLVLHHRKMQCSFRSISSGSHYWRRVCQRARKLHHSSVATYLTIVVMGKLDPTYLELSHAQPRRVATWLVTWV